MKKQDSEQTDTMYPSSNMPGPDKQGKPKQQESQDDDEEDDPLFEEEEVPEDLGEDDEEEYEINDRVSRENMDEIYDYIRSSL